MLVPDDVVSKLPRSPSTSYQRSLSGSWGTQGVTRIVTDHLDVVMKQWCGERQIAMAIAETTVLTRLADVGFPNVAPVVPLSGAPILLLLEENMAWTARDYFPGRSPTPEALTDSAFSHGLGTLLAKFQTALESTGHRPDVESRLVELQLLPDLFHKLSSADSNMVGRAYDLAMGQLDEVLALPCGQLHGDLNLENLIDGPSGLKMIDLEFTRVDVRLLDLAALAAPIRDPTGTLQVAPEDFIRTASSAYQIELSRDFLAPDPDEMKLLPVVSLMHFLLILTDQLRADSRHIDSVLPAIPRLAEQASAFAPKV